MLLAESVILIWRDETSVRETEDRKPIYLEHSHICADIFTVLNLRHMLVSLKLAIGGKIGLRVQDFKKV